jgi:hypothetical protein
MKEIKFLLNRYSHLISNHFNFFLLICLLKVMNISDRNLTHLTDNLTLNLINQVSVQSQTNSEIQQSHNVLSSENVTDIPSTSTDLLSISRFIHIFINTKF